MWWLWNTVSACGACADVREVFDLFDFWDGRDGLVDGFKLGDFLRCCGLNPTVGVVNESGGTKKLGICPVSCAVKIDYMFRWLYLSADERTAPAETVAFRALINVDLGWLGGAVACDSRGHGSTLDHRAVGSSCKLAAYTQSLNEAWRFEQLTTAISAT